MSASAVLTVALPSQVLPPSPPLLFLLLRFPPVGQRIGVCPSFRSRDVSRLLSASSCLFRCLYPPGQCFRRVLRFAWLGIHSLFIYIYLSSYRYSLSRVNLRALRSTVCLDLFHVILTGEFLGVALRFVYRQQCLFSWALIVCSSRFMYCQQHIRFSAFRVLNFYCDRSSFFNYFVFVRLHRR